MHSRRIILLIILVIAFTAIMVPNAAHADTSSVVSGFFNNAIGLSAINFGLDLVRGVVTFIIGQVSFLLQVIINLKLGGGGDIVFTVWKNIRDFCNMGFIVVLVLMSFGTIFDVFKWPFISAYSINAKGVVANFLIAAVLINFSLAIGQTVTLLSDQTTAMVLRILPTDSIGQLLGQLQIATLSNEPIISDQVILGNVPADAQKLFQDCIIKTPSAVSDCYQQAVAKAIPPPTGIVAQATNLATNTLAKAFPAAYQTYQFGAFVTKAWVSSQEAGNASTVSGSLIQIMGKLYSLVLLLMAALSFAVVAVFMFIRIPITWVILAVSPIAFLSLAFPQSDLFKKWSGELIKWSIFSPLYLLVIYFGMFMVKNMGLLVNALGAGGSPPIIAGFLAPLLNYVVISIIFVGGAAAVLSVAKAGGTSAGTVAGSVAGGLGVTGTYGAMGGVATAAKTSTQFVSRQLGVTDQVQAVKERLQQQGREIRTDLRGRLPSVFGPQGEGLAKARERFGVVKGGDVKESGAVEYEKFLKQRVDENRERIERPLKQRLQALENQASRATSPAERERYQGEIKSLKDGQTKQIRDLMQSSNRDTALAAGEILREDNKLTAEELRKMGQQYAQVSPAAAAGFTKRRDTDLVKNAGKQKFDEDLEKASGQIKDFVSVISDGKKADEYYKGLKGGKSKLAALKAGSELGLEKKSSGAAYTFEELASREAPKFTPDDWLTIESSLAKKAVKTRPTKGGRWSELDEMKDIGSDFKDRYLQKLLSPKSKAQMFSGADTAQLKRLQRASKEAFARKDDLMQKKREERLFEEEAKSEEGKAEKKEEEKKEEKKPDEGKKS